MKISDYIDFDLTVTKVDLALTKKCSKYWEFQTEYRMNFGLVYILEGEAFYYFENETCFVTQNDVLYLEKGDKYRTKSTSEEPLKFTVISFDLDEQKRLPFQRITKVIHTKRLIEKFKNIEEAHLIKNPGYKLYCRSLVQQLIYHLLMEVLNFKKRGKNIQASIDYIENYYDKKIKIEDLSNVAGLSVSHFRKTFIEIIGMSPIQYINKLRVEKAKDMIKSGLYSKKEIAKLCGFENVYYFSRVFKKITNVSPGAY